MLTKVVNEKRNDWDEHLGVVLFAYHIAYKINTWHTPFKLVYGLYPGPTTLLGVAHAPLNHCFIFRIFLESFYYVFQKKIKFILFFLNTIMLRCILKNIQKYVTKKYYQIVLLVSKLL